MLCIHGSIAAELVYSNPLKSDYIVKFDLAPLRHKLVTYLIRHRMVRNRDSRIV